jgi:hypothetical protein
VLTAAFVHSGIWHVGLNMLMLWMVGRALEPMLGTGRFVATYLLSAAGGSAGVALLAFATPVVGASGALFGVFGALLVIGRSLGANMTGLYITLGINLVAGAHRWPDRRSRDRFHLHEDPPPEAEVAPDRPPLPRRRRDRRRARPPCVRRLRAARLIPTGLAS